MIRTRHRRVRWLVRGRCRKSRVSACACNQVLAQFILSFDQVVNGSSCKRGREVPWPPGRVGCVARD